MGWEPLVGYVCYMIGALLFNLNTAMSYCNLSEWAEKTFGWGPAVLGSILFTVGGVLECYHNKVWKCECGKLVWWLSVCNCLGGVFFCVAAICGIIGVEGEVYNWLVNFTYLVGSAWFFFGAIAAILMWKGENYGLGLISEINVVKDDDTRLQEILKTRAQYGCGRSSYWQMPWLILYAATASFAVIVCSMSFDI